MRVKSQPGLIVMVFIVLITHVPVGLKSQCKVSHSREKLQTFLFGVVLFKDTFKVMTHTHFNEQMLLSPTDVLSVWDSAL